MQWEEYYLYIGTIILLWFGNYLRMLGMGAGHLNPPQLRGNSLVAAIGVMFFTCGLFFIPSCLGYTIDDQLGWVDYLSDRFAKSFNLGTEANY